MEVKSDNRSRQNGLNKKINKLGTYNRLNGLGRYLESRNGYTYQSVANDLGVSRQAIWSKCHKPNSIYNLSFKMLMKLSVVFGVSWDDLLRNIIELDKK